MILINNTDDAD